MTEYLNVRSTKLPRFIPVPLFLWEKPFDRLPLEAKTLYGMLLSRADLSKINGWIDEYGRVYIYFTIQEVMERLSCGEQKAALLMKRLELCGLLERKRQGCGKPYRIFPKMVKFTAENHAFNG